MLVFGRKNGILASLAHSRDGELFDGERIGEVLRFFLAEDAEVLGNRIHAVDARERVEEGVDGLVLVGRFHMYIIPNPRPMSSFSTAKRGKLVVVNPCQYST